MKSSRKPQTAIPPRRDAETLVPVLWEDCAWLPQVVVRFEEEEYSDRPLCDRRLGRSESLLTSAATRLMKGGRSQSLLTSAPTSITKGGRSQSHSRLAGSAPTSFWFYALRFTRCRSRSTPQARRFSAFTLIELLVVISIIAILAAMLLPVIHILKVRVQVGIAKMQIGQIVTGISSYEQDYGRPPVSSEAIAAAAGTGDDFTFGTYNVTCAGGVNGAFKTPTGSQAVLSPAPGSPAKYQANNGEIMAILLDLQRFGNGTPTVNQNHIKNTQQKMYLAANIVGDTSSPGVGLDGVYRDPWGNPYIITLDLNYDHQTRDAYYRLRSVSQNNGPTGWFGLFNAKDLAGAGDTFEAHAPAMVWSAGPDKMIDPNANANTGANKDNVLSWKQ
jgi:prepilin-type N-terminal cleavage/methylation domain-containing protein